MAQSKAMRDAIGSLNLPSSAVSAFNEPDLLDDLLDHWTSNDHQQERQMLVRRLQVRQLSAPCDWPFRKCQSELAVFHSSPPPKAGWWVSVLLAIFLTFACHEVLVSRTAQNSWACSGQCSRAGLQAKVVPYALRLTSRRCTSEALVHLLGGRCCPSCSCKSQQP